MIAGGVTHLRRVRARQGPDLGSTAASSASPNCGCSRSRMPASISAPRSPPVERCMSNSLVKTSHFVTGASRGIGRAIALELGRRGASVVGTATTVSGARAIDALPGRSRPQGRGVVLDVADATAVEACFKAVDGARGHAVDPGQQRRHHPRRAADAHEAPRTGRPCIDTNLSAVYRTCKAVMRGMMKARKGRIVNIASVIGVDGQRRPDQLRRRQGRHDRFHQEPGPRGRLAQHHRQRGGAGLHRHRHDRRARRSAADGAARRRSRSAGSARRRTSPPPSPSWPSPEAGYITGETLHVNGGMYMI